MIFKSNFKNRDYRFHYPSTGGRVGAIKKIQNLWTTRPKKIVFNSTRKIYSNFNCHLRKCFSRKLKYLEKIFITRDSVLVVLTLEVEVHETPATVSPP